MLLSNRLGHSVLFNSVWDCGKHLVARDDTPGCFYIKALSSRCPAAAFNFNFFHKLKTLSLGILYSFSSMDKFLFYFPPLKWVT